MKLIRRFRKFLEEMKDQKLNRELVGIDRYGNKYYQYYSAFGLPTRREIEPVQKNRVKFFEDGAFYFWLRNHNVLPPTPQELKEYYLKEEERRLKAIEWDRKEQKYFEEFQKKKQLIAEKWKENVPPVLNEFEPEVWKPDFSRNLKQKDSL